MALSQNGYGGGLVPISISAAVPLVHVSASSLKMNWASGFLGFWTSRDSVLDFWWDSH